MQKCRLLSILVVLLLLSFSCFARKRVILKESWGRVVKSVAPTLPIQAWVDDNGKDLLLEFSKELGTLLVTISNQQGEIVHRQSVEADAMTSVIISSDKPMEDGYLLSITDDEYVVYGEIFIY